MQNSLVPNPSSPSIKKKREKFGRKGLGKWPTPWRSQGWNATVREKHLQTNAERPMYWPANETCVVHAPLLYNG